MCLEQYCNELADILKLAMPSLDTEKLLTQLPDMLDDTNILTWLYDALSEQQLCEYNEYKEYWGDLPEIKPLTDLDLDGFSSEDLCNAVTELEENGDIALSYGGEVPWFNFQNHFLKPLGFQVVTFEFENVYLFCVVDDDVVIKKLEEKFKEVKLPFCEHEPLDLDQCIEYLKENNGI